MTKTKTKLKFGIKLVALFPDYPTACLVTQSSDSIA